MIDVAAVAERIDLLGLCPGVQPAGRDRWRGCCPVCNCRTGFSVRRHLGRLKFHCFGCGAGGDSIDLLAALGRTTIGAVLKSFGDRVPEVSDTERVARLADAARANRGEFVACCDRCGRHEEFRGRTYRTGGTSAVLELVASDWMVSDSGRRCLCPGCFMDLAGAA